MSYKVLFTKFFFFGILRTVAAGSARTRPRQLEWAGADFETKIDVESTKNFESQEKPWRRQADGWLGIIL